MTSVSGSGLGSFFFLLKTVDEAPSVFRTNVVSNAFKLRFYVCSRRECPQSVFGKTSLRGYCTTATGTFVFRDVDVDIDNRPLSMAGKTTARHHDHGNTVSYTQGVLSECATYLANRNIAISEDEPWSIPGVMIPCASVSRLG